MTGMRTGLAGKPDPGPKRLTYDQIQMWNDHRRSMPGEQNPSNLWKSFQKKNPKAGFTQADFNNEYGMLQQKIQGDAVRKGTLPGQNTNSDYLFPDVTDEAGKSFGPVNGDKRVQNQPTVPVRTGLAKKLPQGVNPLDVVIDGGKVYFDQGGGDMVEADPSVLNTPEYQQVRGAVPTGQRFTLPGGRQVPVNAIGNRQFYFDPNSKRNIEIQSAPVNR